MAGNSALQQKLRNGIDAARKGDKVTAVKLLREVTAADERNEVAWMWLASVSETLQERRTCLEQALKINPDNTRAQEALKQLSGILPPRPGEQPRRTNRVAGGSLRNSTNVGYTVIAVLVVLALLVAIVFALVSNSQPPVPNTATRVALSDELNTTLTPTSTINPADYTATPFYGVIVTPANLPTFPPAFTPTFTPTATLTPFPSETPIPLSSFSLIYSQYTDGSSQPALFRSNGDGTGSTQIGQASDGFIDPAYDPTGKNIAFVRYTTYTGDSGEQVTAPELFVAPANDMSAARQITKFGGQNMSHPTWSPDGIQIVFVSDLSGNDDLWYTTEDGNNQRPLTTDPGADRDPAWSPNADIILYASERASQPGSGLTEIFSITPDGQTITQLTDADGSSFSPAWSPTGQRVVFVSDRSGDADIFIMDADGQLPFLLTVDDNQAEDRDPVFTPNGQAVVFLSNREEDTFALYMVDLQGKNVQRVTGCAN